MDSVTPMIEYNGAGLKENGNNGVSINTKDGAYKGKRRNQLKHTNIEHHEKSKNTSESLFSILTNVVSGGVDGGRFVCEKSSGGAGGYAKRFGRNDNGSGNKVGSDAPVNGGSQSTPKAANNKSSSAGECSRTSECVWIFGAHPDNFEPNQNFSIQLSSRRPNGASKGRESRDRMCVKDVEEETILEAIIPPMVETPTIIKSSKRLLRFETKFTTRLDLEQGVQRIFKIRLCPMVEMNQEMRSMEELVRANECAADNNHFSLFSDFSMKILTWNCRGLARPSFRRVMKQLIKKHKPSVVALLETRTITEHAT
ncbi:uncharacterized protein LOC113347933 [Papaver somniferum]|uniref:uncharacterized protein LOC113347933 n=1 Tax=Papaver somniferum TaxID=3469 RepID=UPI000E702364|nr:uncharacterized protein LOC113347933 [Papaver somniferum]XP_026447411.1 uncharacterized protein LOC113347933 [Papaver somniferum]XP_026447412.1 uncharacterized protein LOC113347933 [Papaver somniferum]XP_026447413.1 uncharacterized protein LOC113347933 [Papaver somniferum]